MRPIGIWDDWSQSWSVVPTLDYRQIARAIVEMRGSVDDANTETLCQLNNDERCVLSAHIQSI